MGRKVNEVECHKKRDKDRKREGERKLNKERTVQFTVFTPVLDPTVHHKPICSEL